MSPSHRADTGRPVLSARVAARFGAALVLVGGLVALRAAMPGTTIELGTSATAATAPTTATAATVAEPAPPPEQAGADLVVHVTGAVVNPGVAELPPGARVADAVAAAGGMTEDADESALNLAALVVDGTQVYVPRIGEGPPPIAAAPSGAAQESGLVNLNTADAAGLATLPGIGPALADRIITYRETHGPFGTVADLDAVSGIGPSILAQIDGKATV